VRPYLESRGAGFAGWDPNTRAVLINTRFANVSQLHRVAMPMGARTQISFEAEPVSGSYAPTKGDVLLVTKDRGGDEYYQLHTLKDGRLTLLTDGKSRNEPNAWSKDGELVAFSSPWLLRVFELLVHPQEDGERVGVHRALALVDEKRDLR
jgi:hypothetical protein